MTSKNNQTEATPATRDMIVMGASLGGVDALSRLLAQLPADLPAAIFVVQHMQPYTDSHLAAILSKASPLPVREALNGEKIRVGQVYLAPPDQHLLVANGTLRVGRGPRENRARPAIDPLFRTAAHVGRSRTIGVILTGLLDDGAAGLAAIKQCGGVTIVQDPKDALHSSMPEEALRASQPDYVVPLSEMGAILDGLSRQPAPQAPPVPAIISLEARLTERSLGTHGHVDSIHETEQLGSLTPLTCPDCGGSLWRMGQENRFRCHVGHAYSIGSLMSEQDEKLEHALWAAVRSLEERSKTLESLADRNDLRPHGVPSSYRDRAKESGDYASRIRDMLMTYSQGWPEG